MKIVLYTDNTLPLAIEPLCNLLNSVCEKIAFAAGAERLRIDSSSISCPSSYSRLPKSLFAEANSYDFAIMCTNVPYENNFFFEYEDNNILVSFSGWNLLTDLPVTNGLVYFIASILCDELGIGETHNENTGCVNDFWWDKTGVDLGMRAAFICRDCLNEFRCDTKVVEDIQHMLDLVSTASRLGKDVLNMAPVYMEASDQIFDVFLCHNSDDKPTIRKLNAAFRSAGIATWFDEEQLEPGVPWQLELEKQISNVRKAIVFVGKSGIGPWQNAEIRAFLSEFVNRGCPVIPVFLPNAKKIPELPIFLKQMTWVDLRKDYERNLGRLIGAIQRR